MTTVSETLGYAQPSTFIASFRRVMGTTPGAYVDMADEFPQDVRNQSSEGVRNPVVPVQNS